MKDLVLGQAKINENLTKKLLYNYKMIENINSKLEKFIPLYEKPTKF